MEIDIFIDTHTNCLIDRKSGEICETTFHKVPILTPKDAKILLCEGWRFDWSIPQQKAYEVYELKVGNEREGLIAIKHMKSDYYTHVDIVESAPYNIGRDGKYEGVGAHLFAIACMKSWECGNEGFVQFTAKTNLVEHYKKKFVCLSFIRAI